MNYKIFSLGCKVNSYECSALASLLNEKGYEPCLEGSPDAFIINTCSVTQTADQKSRQHIRKFQRENPSSIIVVMGCYSQGNADFIAKDINPQILIGTSHRNEIPDLIDEYLKTRESIVKVDDNPRLFNYEEFVATACSENTRAYLKIEDGCNNFCTYCLIPYRRGRLRSRQFDDVMNEARHLVKLGYQEIVLTGIHVGGYGEDLENASFSSLVESLLNIEGLKSLRISSIEASEIDDKLISFYGKYPNLARHIHIPLQSGSEHILKLMGRKYTKAQFLEKIKKLKEQLPDVALSTDVIVGFPSETEEEFLESKAFIEECGFHQLHVFPFSAREGTPAYEMKNQIDPRIKKARVGVLLDLSKKLWEEYVSRFIDKELPVLIERKENDYLIGRTSNYIELKISSKEEKVGDIINVKITKNMIISK